MSLDQRLFLQKNKGRWTEEECQRFEDAFFTHGSKWKLIARAVGSRSLVQVRSHAQKVVQRLQERGPSLSKPKDTDLGVEPHRVQGNPTRTMQDHSKMYETWLYHTMKAAQIFQTLKEQNRTTSTLPSGSAEEGLNYSNPESN